MKGKWENYPSKTGEERCQAVRSKKLIGGGGRYYLGLVWGLEALLKKKTEANCVGDNRGRSTRCERCLGGVLSFTESW